MTAALDRNTQAILLLTAPLIVGRSYQSGDILGPGEYHRLTLHLRGQGREPADLLGPEAEALVQECSSVIDLTRLQRLLQRGFQLSEAVERWHTRAIWIVSRAEAAYPRRFKARLKDIAPSVLYGCGDMTILESGGLAVVGSRDVDDELTEYAGDVGRLAARAEKTLVSGGARGIDQAAMRNALERGGKAIGVLADGLEKAAMNRDYRRLLLEQQLVLVSPYDPSAGLHVGNAMQRNKLIYAFADAALVVNSDVNKGGTWAGAIEQLQKFRFVPIYVRSTGEVSKGLQALLQNGALPWPNPQDPDELVATLGLPPVPNGTAAQEKLPLSSGDRSPQLASNLTTPHVEAAEDVALLDIPVDGAPAERLFSRVREILVELLVSPKSEAQISAALRVSNSQTREWLQRLVDDGTLERRNRPASFIVRPNGLFESMLRQDHDAQHNAAVGK